MSKLRDWTPYRRITVLVHPSDQRSRAIVLFRDNSRDSAFEQMPVRSSPALALEDALALRRQTGIPIDDSLARQESKRFIDRWNSYWGGRVTEIQRKPARGACRTPPDGGHAA